MLKTMGVRDDIQRDNIQSDDIQRNDIQRNDTYIKERIFINFYNKTLFYILL